MPLCVPKISTQQQTGWFIALGPAFSLAGTYLGVRAVGGWRYTYCGVSLVEYPGPPNLSHLRWYGIQYCPAIVNGQMTTYVENDVWVLFYPGGVNVTWQNPNPPSVCPPNHLDCGTFCIDCAALANSISQI
jgi:hypothetical protein